MVCFHKRKQELINLYHDAQDLEITIFCVFLFNPKDLTASKTPSQFIAKGLLFLFSKQELRAGCVCVLTESPSLTYFLNLEKN